MTSHRKSAVFLAFGLLLAVSGDSALAQNHGDVGQGHVFAQRVCAECHSVEKGEDAPELVAPSFTKIANSPGVSPIALSVILRTPHETMPNLVLEGEELNNIIAYITSLKD